MSKIKLYPYTPYGFSASTDSLLSGFMGEVFSTRVEGYILGNGYRTYSPTIMRFHSPDNMSPFHAGGYNAYAAFMNNPVNKVDPTGHYPMTVMRAVSRFKASIRNRAMNKTLPALTDAHPEDRSKALVRYKKRTDISDSDFRLITSHRDIKFLAGEERKYILTNRGDFVVGNQNTESFPHPMLKYFAGRDSNVISAGYVALREKIVVFSNTTGHYHSSMAGKDVNSPVVDFFKSIGIIARRVRGDGNSEISLSYNPWIDFSF
ncbi:RHS repeat-associated core domain-containing protein [Pseudomonas sp. TWI929]|uniref:RHS repeat-associated core domain-containing protein n=1 Tax=Pseudomonas sp. TWI929 TaxID=3136795 RepID=UPI0032095525